MKEENVWLSDYHCTQSHTDRQRHQTQPRMCSYESCNWYAESMELPRDQTTFIYMQVETSSARLSKIEAQDLRMDRLLKLKLKHRIVILSDRSKLSILSFSDSMIEMMHKETFWIKCHVRKFTIVPDSCTLPTDRSITTFRSQSVKLS